MFKRIFVIVIDSLGIGEMEDSKKYDDLGANTLEHIAEKVKLNIPNLQKLGLANLCDLKNVPKVEKPLGYFAKVKEKSNGKDTMTGHWEMMGIETKVPFKTFTDTGFPQELIKELEEKTGRKIIGNKSSSGTEILDELAEEEINKGYLIVYTSADSVLQICGNEETMGLENLYKYCEIARELTMKEDWKVGRIIARPYTGAKKGEFKRTSNRHDYALAPPEKTVLDILKDNNFDVISIGKINDIFAEQGITKAIKSKSSVEGMEQAIEVAKNEYFNGLCFVNLVDFDALWGHRRDTEGYAKELEMFDEKLGIFLEALHQDDLLIITADHGNDPTYKGTDHTREKVPFIAYSKNFKDSGKLDEQNSFAVIGATILDNFNLKMPKSLIDETSLIYKLK
ncbi:phosphopentomutase [Candidatus Epulonipiscium fishelsonii]|uniref:Phosphopentomutase n=1 Tax=Candidatus Epulonipiscium fishelsonii TaxID=77094 RepID=A0ACC8XIK0_9FIRM|nr:phosphopentomutase [Epulopiscium sp. SCG-D08WGA-EpuloA1]OON93793.1 MAG: phosphopentomutase [Epulopiscium sp. AS2M-Bin002]